jgi:nitrite reductase/ring-hydroxylating ferredoxin subunit
MTKHAPQWIRVAALSDVPIGETKAVRLEEGRSIALFNVDGRIYATDNQCPHMGYPLTRGAVRHGILTCDWHGRSFDLEGGGCSIMNAMICKRSPDVRQDEVWTRRRAVQAAGEHLRLLWEGLLSEDRWTISKAIALLLKGSVPEKEIVEMVLRHLGRHIASSEGAEESGGVSRLINGLKVGRRYEDADRLMVLATAACSVAGGAAKRLEVVPLPGRVSWHDLDRWTRMFSHDGQSGRIERCLFTACHLDYQDKILSLPYECAVEPYFLGIADNLLTGGYLAEIIDSFGWDQSSNWSSTSAPNCSAAGAWNRNDSAATRLALMSSMAPTVEASNPTKNSLVEYDEESFVSALASVNIQKVI